MRVNLKKFACKILKVYADATYSGLTVQSITSERAAHYRQTAKQAGKSVNILEKPASPG